MYINFEFGCSEETRKFFVAQEVENGFETVGELQTGETDLESGACGDLIEGEEEGEFYYHICENCASLMENFGKFPENLPEHIYKIKAKLDDLGFSPYWLEDQIEVEHGFNILLEENSESFIVSLGAFVEEEIDDDFIKNIERKFKNIEIEKIDEDEAGFNLSFTRKFDSVKDLSGTAIDLLEADVDKILDMLLEV